MDKLNRSRCAHVGSTCVCHNLRKTSRLMSQIYDDYLRPSGLKATQFSLLMTIRGFGEITVSRLAKHAVMDRTTVARNVQLLGKKNLVSVASGSDQRERVVSITETGAKALESALPMWEQAQGHIDEVLGADRAAQIVRELSAAVSALKNKGTSA
jgi:DNA-binding MarR family transcriptional regulator